MVGNLRSVSYNNVLENGDPLVNLLVHHPLTCSSIPTVFYLFTSEGDGLAMPQLSTRPYADLTLIQS